MKTRLLSLFVIAIFCAASIGCNANDTGANSSQSSSDDAIVDTLDEVITDITERWKSFCYSVYRYYANTRYGGSVSNEDKKTNEMCKRELIAYIQKIAEQNKSALPNQRYSKENFEYPLHVAADYGNLEVVRELIKSGADVNQGHDRHAVERLRLKKSERGRLLIRSAIELGEYNTPDRSTSPLYYAAAEGHAEIVKELINAGANVNGVHEVRGLRNWYFISPLYCAARGGHVEMAKELIKAGADVNRGYVELERLEDDYEYTKGGYEYKFVRISPLFVAKESSVEQSYWGSRLKPGPPLQLEEIAKILEDAGAKSFVETQKIASWMTSWRNNTTTKAGDRRIDDVILTAVRNNDINTIKEIITQVPKEDVYRYYEGGQVFQKFFVDQELGSTYVPLLFIAAADSNVNVETIECLLDLGVTSPVSSTILVREQILRQRVISGIQRDGSGETYRFGTGDFTPVDIDFNKTIDLLEVASSPKKKVCLQEAIRIWNESDATNRIKKWVEATKNWP